MAEEEEGLLSHHAPRMFVAGWGKVFQLLEGRDVASLAVVAKDLYQASTTLKDSDWQEKAFVMGYGKCRPTWKESFQYHFSALRRAREERAAKEREKLRQQRHIRILRTAAPLLYLVSGTLPSSFRRTFMMLGAAATSLLITRLLRRDYERYCTYDDDDVCTEEMGWKLVHGDVFRDPRKLRPYYALVAVENDLCTIPFTSNPPFSPQGTGLLFWLCASFCFAIPQYFMGNSLPFWPAVVAVLYGVCMAIRVILTSPARWASQFAYVSLFSLPFVLLLFVPLHAGKAVERSSSLATDLLALTCGAITIRNTMGMGKLQHERPPVRVHNIPRAIFHRERLSWLFLPISLPALAQVQALATAVVSSADPYFMTSPLVLWELFWLCVELALLVSPVMVYVVIYRYLDLENYHWWWPCLLFPMASVALCFGVCACFLPVEGLQNLWVLPLAAYCVGTLVASATLHVVSATLRKLYVFHVD